MIETKEQQEQETGLIPKFTKKDMLAAFCLLLELQGGKIGISNMRLKSFPDGVQIKAEYDIEAAMWIISLPPRKRKRGIITPKHKLIVPN